MSFVRFSGWTVEIDDGAADFSVSWLDPDFKSELGKQVIRRRRRQTSWSFETIALTALEAETVEGFVGGLAHTWSFESTTAFAFSSRGRAPISAASLTRSTTLARFGAACGLLSGSIGWDMSKGIAPLLDRWTVSVWRNAGAALTDWQHFVVRSDGAVWVDGVRDDTVSTSWLSIFNGFLFLTDTAVRFDDLCVMCFCADDVAIESWHAWQVAELAPMPDFPEIHVEGTFLDGLGLDAIGTIQSSSVVTFVDDGEWLNNARSVGFMLQVRKAEPVALATSPTVWLSMDTVDGDPPTSSTSETVTTWAKTGGVTVGVVEGQVGQAASFDGTGYLSPPSTGTMGFSVTTNFAIAAWVNPRDAAQPRTVASKIANGVAGWLWFLRPVTGGHEVVFRMQNAAGTLFREVSGGLVQVGEWHHIGIIHAANAVRFDLVVDGEIVEAPAKVLTLATSITNTEAMRIGGLNLPSGDTFVGEIDEFLSWSRAVSVAAVEAVYDAGRNRMPPVMQSA